MKRLLITISILVLTVFDINSVYAFDVDYYSDNNIRYYIPEGDLKNYFEVCGVGDGSGINISVSGGSAAEKIWSGLLQGGLTPEQAAGVMGNLRAESGLSPTIHESTFRGRDIWNESNAHGIGLAQWSFGRRTALLKLLEKDGLLKYIEDYQTYSVGGEELVSKRLIPDEDLDRLFSVEIQLIFDEMHVRKVRDGGGQTEIEGIRQTSTPEEAAAFFHWNFERPANPSSSARQVYAREFYEQLNGSSGSSGMGYIECDYGGLTETVLAYAWPEHHPANYLEMMPAYKEAVARARSEGRYVGGGPNPGIDCGGFVTTLVHDSGLDPTYNHNAKGGFTGNQESWLKDPNNGWVRINSDGRPINEAELQPGDVAHTDGHTFIWVGSIPGFGEPGPHNSSKLMVASASYSTTGRSWRAPMAGKESPRIDGKGTVVRWYRKTK